MNQMSYSREAIMKESKPSSYRRTHRKKNFSVGKPPMLVVDRLENLDRLPTDFPASSGELE